jgi:hypothetical protein
MPDGKPTSEQLYLWKFAPIARPDDPAWQGRQIWADFRIVAATAGEAIWLASRHDHAERGISVERAQDRQQLRSGLEDPRLYRLDRLQPVDSARLPRGTVISKGRFVP